MISGNVVGPLINLATSYSASKVLLFYRRLSDVVMNGLKVQKMKSINYSSPVAGEYLFNL